MVDGNKLGDVGFQKLGTPYNQMDCQAFVEWCLRQCGENKNLAGSNAWYREVYNHGRVLTPEECVKELGCVPKGAFLFILEHDGGEPEKYKPDGLGNASHIGICTIPRGEGAIHSSASRGCVAESKFKQKTINGGWNRVGLYNKVSYDYGGGDKTPVPDVDPDQDSDPTPSPEPTPAHRPAIVWSENGDPVNTRKGPGKNYALSKAGKLAVGTHVEIIDTSGEWSKISVVDKHNAEWYCWIMTRFLRFGDDIPQEPVYDDTDQDSGLVTVHIAHLTEEEADNIMMNYEDAWTTPE